MKSTEGTGEPIAAQKLALAAKNMQRILKINEDQTSLGTIAGSLEQTMIDAHANNPIDICDMMAVQTQMLDAVFHQYVDRAAIYGSHDEDMEFALKSQNQMVRTALAWKRLKTDTYIKRKIIRISPAQENPDGTN